ncbi:MAG: GAF domain-containing protein [Anaerolineae bacterium]
MNETVATIPHRDMDLAILMSELATVANQSLDLSETLEVSMDKILEVIGCDTGCMVLLEVPRRKVRVGAPRRIEQALVENLEAMELDDESWRILEDPYEGLSIISHLADVVKQKAKDAGLSSVVILPLQAKSKELGLVLIVNGDEPVVRSRSFDLLAAIGTLVGTAVENAKLHQQLAATEKELLQRNRELAAQNALATVISKSLDLDEILDSALEEVMAITGAGAGRIYVVDEQGTNFLGQTVRGTSPDFAELLASQKPTEGWTGQVIRSGHPMVIDDVLQPEYKEWLIPGTLEQNVRSFLCVPLRIKDKVRGVLEIGFREPGQAPAEGLVFLRSISSYLALAIENARLYKETRVRGERLEALREIALDITSHLELQETLDRIVCQAANLLEAQSSDICLYDWEKQQGTVMVYYGMDAVPGWSFPLDEEARGVLGRVALSGEPMIVNDYQSWDKKLLTEEAANVTAVIGVPLKWQDQTVGVLCVNDDREGRVFDQDDLRLLELLVPQATIAIENAKLYHEIAAERGKLDTILNSLADGIVTTDEERRILTFNRALEELTGWKADEVRGKFCGEVLGLRDPSGAILCKDEDCPLLQVMNGGQSIPPFPTIESALRGRDGREIPVTSTVAPIPSGDGDGRIVGAVAAAWDASRYAEIEHLKRELVSIFSHEVRHPTFNIKMAAEHALKPGVSQAMVRQRLETIVGEADRLQAFADQIVRLSQIEMELLQAEEEPVTLIPIVKKVVKSFETRAAPERFVWSLADNLPFVLGDMDKIEIVLSNLVDNAIRYSLKDSKITIEARELDEERVMVSVTDQGKGIPPKHQKRIFERFYRIEEGDSAASHGHGLGLYIAKKFVEAQGGEIGVESEAGKGSCFYFTLPKLEEMNYEGTES